ncbi:recombinase family protein [Streptomyces sp. A3M-1-3]|uniref:recombinase family protein n=1 Tax=Streptomyces sp. A3M-1-3 TaxID=2962044 RepID=UPI0020B768F8|nr:recombinase family protein [Streptomyces sp. A3M-1-3]MCP3820440.1 recombinase family protein [Streptomyces sp. A3M-1-3]
MMENPRVLGVVRLSVVQDDTTSPARQRQHIQHWADTPNIMGTIVGWAEDLDVSGSLDPFKRPGLGPWLAEHADEFDVLCVWKLDRLTRRSLHFSQLLEWCDRNGKFIVSTSEGFDLSTPMGKTFARIIAAFAEGEWEAIRARNMDAQRKLVEDGAWHGGQTPMGYVLERREEGGKVLVQDETYGPLMRQIVRDIEDGMTMYRICRELNEKGVPSWRDHLRLRAGQPSRNGEWRTGPLEKALKNPRMTGVQMFRGQIVDDDDGNPRMINDEPLLTLSEWHSVLSRLEERSPANRASRTTYMLSGIAKCGKCEGPMYIKVRPAKGKPREEGYYHYVCGRAHRGIQCDGSATSRKDDLEAVIDEALLTHLGQSEVMVKAAQATTDHRAELSAVQGRLARLERDFLNGRYDEEGQEESYWRMHRSLSGKGSRLKELVAKAPEQKYVGTGKKFAEMWAAKDAEDRRAFLTQHKVSVTVYKSLVEWSPFSAVIELGDLTAMAMSAGLAITDSPENQNVIVGYQIPAKGAPRWFTKRWPMWHQGNPFVLHGTQADRPTVPKQRAVRESTSR